MNDEQVELTSSLLDGELDSAGQARAISAILDGGDEELERFGRYRLIGDVMRGESAVLATSVAQRVHQALRDEPVVLAPPRRHNPGWLRPLAGLAVAASVAAAAVVVAPQLLTQSEQQAPPIQVTAGLSQPAMTPLMVAAGPAARPDLPMAGTTGTGAHWQALDPGLEERLNRLVIEHQEFAGRTGINGPVPHIGFVSYDAR